MIAGASPKPATAAGRERMPKEMVSATMSRPHCLKGKCTVSEGSISGYITMDLPPLQDFVFYFCEFFIPKGILPVRHKICFLFVAFFRHMRASFWLHVLVGMIVEIPIRYVNNSGCHCVGSSVVRDWLAHCITPYGEVNESFYTWLRGKPDDSSRNSLV